MKKLTFLFVLSGLLFSMEAFSQYEREDEEDEGLSGKKFIERSFWGGNASFYLGSGSGTSSIYFEISPLAGYRLNSSLAVGILTTYKYFSGRNTYYNVNYNTSVWGGGLFARLHIGEKFYLQGEIETLNTEAYNNLFQKFERKFIQVASAGIGYGPKDAGYSYAYIQLTYDFIADKDSPYPASPLIPKIGIIFPFGKRD